ncbi:2-Hydroxyacid oxidase 1-like isoform X1 [Panonychus citri]|uniref:2-Hydroxyacid oxidase 1-like isoform X1 n=1 Tax=Panonychus citri TaxID=50023 RepID=UPI0023077B1F|nr:2-Hydroxyacid oxidase 1-like isoform X1 [Panonychus citri]
MNMINESSQQLANGEVKLTDKLINLKEFEVEAHKRVDKDAWGYYKSGANYEVTLRENEGSYNKLRIRPRFFNKDVSQIDMRTKVQGQQIAFPIGVSPTAMQRMANPIGEIGTARACREMNTVYTMSTLATWSVEDVAREAPGGLKWLQLYIYKDREVSLRLVRRAEAAGFKALVVTVDLPIMGQRYDDMRNKFVLPEHYKLANFSDELAAMEKDHQGFGFQNYVTDAFDATLTWKDVEWFKNQTRLPLIVKGILTAEDAILAVDHGASGIVVSNHGARQLDTVPTSIEVLPEIVRAVGHKVEIYLDGGIRSGTDVLKALALGAKMVFIGRPAIWGLACGGESGVIKVLQIIKQELKVAMALSGCPTLEDITPSLICRSNSFWSNL